MFINKFYLLLLVLILPLLVLFDVVPLLLVLVALLFGCAPPIMEVKVVAKAAVKLGSAAMATLTVSARCGGGR